MNLREILLSKYDFIQNDYFNKYIELILNYDQKSVVYREAHHVVPVMHYKNDNIKSREAALKLADLDKDNFTVNLLFKDHCYAHYLLYNCTTGGIKAGNALVVKFFADIYNKFMQDSKVDKFNYTDFETIQLFYDNIISDPNNNLGAVNDIQFLIDNYPIYGQRYCAEKLNRSLGAVSTKAKNLGIKMNKWWSETDIDFLKVNFEQYTIDELASILGRTKKSIISTASKLGLTPQPLYTEDDIKFLKLNYTIYGPAYCANYLHRTIAAVKRKAAYLNLKSPQGAPIYCPELDKQFISISEAAAELQLSDGNICQVVNGKSKTTKGLHFFKLSRKDYYEERKS